MSSSNNTGSTNFGFPPPVLPAFLITGFFIAAAVTLCTWRHFQWQTRRANRARAALVELDNEITKRRIPKLWDVWVDGGNESGDPKIDWNTVMVGRQASCEDISGLMFAFAAIVSFRIVADREGVRYKLCVWHAWEKFNN